MAADGGFGWRENDRMAAKSSPRSKRETAKRVRERVQPLPALFTASEDDVRRSLLSQLAKFEEYIGILREDLAGASMNSPKFEIARRQLDELVANLSPSRFGGERRARMLLVAAIDDAACVRALCRLAASKGHNALVAWTRGRVSDDYVKNWLGLRDPVIDWSAWESFSHFQIQRVRLGMKLAEVADANFAAYRFKSTCAECAHYLADSSDALDAIEELISLWPLPQGRRKAGEIAGSKWTHMFALVNALGFEKTKERTLINDWAEWQAARGEATQDLPTWRRYWENWEKREAGETNISGGNIQNGLRDPNSPHAETAKQDS